MKILKSALTPTLKETIYEGFKDHDIEKTGTSGIEEPICFYIEAKGKIVSSIVCRLFWGALHIKYVYTHKEHRNNGHASSIMKEVMSFAEKNKCPFAFIETMNFQAPEFYKKFGFEVEFERSGFSQNTSFLYLRKWL